MSRLTRLDSWLRRWKEVPAEASIAAFVVGAIILFAALPAGVADYTVTLLGKNNSPINKQVGIWLGAINWVVEFLVILPLLLFFLIRMASTARDIIDDLVSKGLIEHQGAGEKHSTDEYHKKLDVTLSSHSITIDLIAIGTFFVTLLLWYGAAGKDIITCSTDDRLIFWGNGVVKDNRCGDLVLAYSVLAYAWLGVLIFTYITSLRFCTLYSSFLGKLFAGRLAIDNPNALVSVRTGPMALDIIKPLTFEISMICTLGLLTIFFLNVQLAYLTSGAPNISEFLTRYVFSLDRLLARFFPKPLLQTQEAVLATRDDLIALPSFVLFAITMVSFTAAIYVLWMGVRQSVLRPGPAGESGLEGAGKSVEELPVSVIFMGFRPSITVAFE